MAGIVQPPVYWSLPVGPMGLPPTPGLNFMPWVSVPVGNFLRVLCVPTAVTEGNYLLTSRGNRLPHSVNVFDVSYVELNAFLIRMCRRPEAKTALPLHNALNPWGL